MAKTITKFRIFTIADYIEEQKWLEEQHKKGWKLVKFIPPFLFKFEECEPDNFYYQLDFKNEKASSDYIGIFNDYGWEYCGSCFGWNYFRKPEKLVENESEKEIFSDNESRLDMISHIYKTRMIPLLVVFLTIIMPNVVRGINNHSGAGRNAIYYMFLVLFIVYVMIIGYCGRKLNKIKNDNKK